MIFSDENYFNALTEFELLFLCFLFAWNYPRRSKFWLRVVSCFAFFVALAFLTYSLDLGNSVLSGTVNYLLLFIFADLSLAFCYHVGFSSHIFCTIVGYTVRHLIYLVWQFSTYLYDDNAPHPNLGFSWVWVVLSCGSAILFLPLVIYLYKLIKKTPNVTLPSWEIIVLSGLSLLIDDILNMFVITNSLGKDGHVLEYIICLFNILSGLMILVIMFGFVSQNNLEKEVASINQMRHEEQKQYQMTKENIELINIKCHDLRKQIRALKESHSAISQEEINTIEDATRIYDTKVVTGNSSLDVVLQEKSLICAKNKIVFNCIIDGSALNFMTESDVFSLFGNIIDNAIESAVKLDSLAQRVITVKIKKVPGGVFAYEENYYAGTLHYADGLPVSTKGDDRYHGFGMKSIRMIVNHYQGDMQINTNNQTFAISIFFPVAS